MLNRDLKGKRVVGLFSGDPYTGVVIESVVEETGYNHVIRLDRRIVKYYNNQAQTKRNNKMVLEHVNFHAGEIHEGHELYLIKD
jgi:hypothetical protein